MTKQFIFNVKPKIISEIDLNFRPPVLANRQFLDAVNKTKTPVLVRISIERMHKESSTYETFVFPDYEDQFDANCYYIERLVKSLLWIKGGWKITFGGPKNLGEYLQKIYTKT